MTACRPLAPGLWLLALCLVVTLPAGPAASSMLHAPHDQAAGITCTTCHAYPTGAWPGYVPDPADPDDTLVTFLCLGCHGENGNAPLARLHSATTTASRFTDWTTTCTTCHDPHFQAQLTYKDDDAIFLVRGVADDYTVDPDTTQPRSTLSYHGAAAAPGWEDPGRWAAKTGPGRGLLLVFRDSPRPRPLEVVAADATTITVAGDLADLETGPSRRFGLLYGQMLRATVTGPDTAAHPVRFAGPASAIDSGSPPTGICQVCHQRTDHWRADGSRADHQLGAACVSCHTHAGGFGPPGAAPCGATLTWTAACQACHDANLKILTGIHGLGAGNDCTLCHTDGDGPELRADNAAANATPGHAHPCDECHANNPGIHHAAPHAQDGDCAFCHPDPRPAWRDAFGVDGPMETQLACRACHLEPTSNGLVVVGLHFPVDPTLTMRFAGDDPGRPAVNPPLLVRTVLDGNNGTTDHRIAADHPIVIRNFGACLSCHDGGRASRVTVWHGRPRLADLPPDPGDDARHNHFDILRHAPGRSRFNLFRGDGHQGPAAFSHPDGYYDNGGEAEKRGEDFYDAQGGRKRITWNWGQEENFTLVAIPCFAQNDPDGRCGNDSGAPSDQVPVFTGPPQADTITPLLAALDGTTLQVRATNTHGTLAVRVNGTEYPMTEERPHHWSLSLDLAAIPDPPTVDLVTDNPLGADLTGISLCSADPLALEEATWTRTDPGRGTLHVRAANPAAAPVVVHAAGADHAAAWDGAAWTLDLAGVAYDSTMWLASGCGRIDPAVPRLEANCDPGNGADHILLPLAKAEYDPASGQLTVEARNSRDTAGGTTLWCTFFDGAGSHGPYPMAHTKPKQFQYQGAGFTWRPGATVTVWSTDDSGALQAQACDQPVTAKHGDDSLTLVTAQWRPEERRLEVAVTNALADNARIYGEYQPGVLVPFTWEPGEKIWRLVLDDVDYAPEIIVHSDQDAVLYAPVADLTPDPVTVVTALWLPEDNGPGRLFVRAANQEGSADPLLADYGANRGMALTWEPANGLWQLDRQGLAYSATVEIGSTRPGRAAAAVVDGSGIHRTMVQEPVCQGCHTDSDIVLGIHDGFCDLCHQSEEPAVEQALAGPGPSGCTACHLPIDESVRVAEVGFAYPGSPAIPLRDHELPVDDDLITAPEYRDGIANHAAAYVRGTPVVIQVRFSADPSIDSARISSSLFSAREVRFTDGISEPVYFTLPASVTDTPGAFILTIDWRLCDENGSGAPDCAVPSPLHATRHELLVTRAQPAGSPPFFAQLVHWASQWAAPAADDDETVQRILDGVWSLGEQGYDYVFPFRGRTYDKVGDILRQRQGACGEWAILLQRAIESQGIDVYTVATVPDRIDTEPVDRYRVRTDALGANHGPWEFPDHTFVIYRGDITRFGDPTLGTALDPTFHRNADNGWGGYEDVIVDEMHSGSQGWLANPGLGPAADVVNSRLLRVIDDWLYTYPMDQAAYDAASLYYAPRDGDPPGGP